MGGLVETDRREPKNRGRDFASDERRGEATTSDTPAAGAILNNSKRPAGRAADEPTK